MCFSDGHIVEERCTKPSPSTEAVGTLWLGAETLIVTGLGAHTLNDGNIVICLEGFCNHAVRYGAMVDAPTARVLMQPIAWLGRATKSYCLLDAEK